MPEWQAAQPAKPRLTSEQYHRCRHRLHFCKRGKAIPHPWQALFPTAAGAADADAPPACEQEAAGADAGDVALAAPRVLDWAPAAAAAVAVAAAPLAGRAEAAGASPRPNLYGRWISAVSGRWASSAMLSRKVVSICVDTCEDVIAGRDSPARGT